MIAWFRKEKPEVLHPAVPAEDMIENKLKAFITAKSKLVAASDIDSNTNVFSSGLLDSLSFIELVLFIEKEFQIRLSKTTDINMNTMDSIGQIIKAVLKCVEAEQAAHNESVVKR